MTTETTFDLIGDFRLEPRPAKLRGVLTNENRVKPVFELFIGFDRHDQAIRALLGEENPG